MELLIYLLKVSACTVLFFAFYLLVLRKLTFFKINRFYLLLTLLLSFLIPTLNFTIEREVEAIPTVYTQSEIVDEVVVNEPISAVGSIETTSIIEESFDYYSLLPYLYFGIVFSLLVIATWRILQLLKHTKNDAEWINGLKIVQKSSGFTNCSFFNYVFIDDKLSEAELQILLKHEEVHAKQFHSIDKIIMMLIKAVLWFNPVVYLFDKALEQAHEYEADEATSQNFGAEQYANLLLRLAIAKSEMPLVHNFVKSPIKERIKMLFNSKSKNMKKLMYLLALPIGLGLLWGFTVKVVEVSKVDIIEKENEVIKHNSTLDKKLIGKTLRGKVKSILQTEVGEVLNFKYDKGIIRVFNYAKSKVRVSDELSITVTGIVEGIKISDSKGNVVKQLDGPCYGMDLMKTLDGKVLFDIDNRPFLSKSAVMQYGQYKSERFTLHTVSGKIPSLRILHSPISSEPSKVFIYVNGKLYSEKETLKFDKKFIASLSEKRGFAKADDYDISTIDNKGKTYIFWFGREPKLTIEAEKSRNSSQNRTIRKAEGQLTQLTNPITVKTLDVLLVNKNNLKKIKPILLRSTSINVDTKTDISYIKNGVIKIGEKQSKHKPKDSYQVKSDQIKYTAKDSIHTNKKTGDIYLYGGAVFESENMIFSSDQMVYNKAQNILKVKKNAQIFDKTSKSTVFTDSLHTNLKTGKGILFGKVFLNSGG